MKHDRNILIHTSSSPDPTTLSVIPPVNFSTIFAMEKPSSDEGFQYGRVGNPTRLVLEKTLAKLHDAKYACVFSSGSAAITTVLATLQKGDHIICHDVVYEGTMRIMTKLFNKFGVTVSFVDLKNPVSITKAFNKRTKLVWIETPTNPLLEILNVRAISEFAHKHRTLMVVDNTFATPIIQKPLQLGADIVVESLSKGINGHSDVIGGLIAVNDEKLFRTILFLQHTMGAVLSPFDCFLIQRGLKTLLVRVHQQEHSAKLVAAWLQKQPSISHVFFPDLRSNTVQKQMAGCGTMISFTVNTKIISASKFLSRLTLIIIAHSLGGTETLIQQPTTMMDLSFPKNQLVTWGITDNFFRLSVGLEHHSDIIADLKQALATK